MRRDGELTLYLSPDASTVVIELARHGTAHPVAFITFLYGCVVESNAVGGNRV